jgi:hypothetical protein
MEADFSSVRLPGILNFYTSLFLVLKNLLTFYSFFITHA